MNVDIYSFSEPRDFLNAVLEDKKNKNPRFSARSWAQKMGFKNHTSLLLLLNGKRPIRSEHVQKINSSLGLENEEETYFRLLVQRSTCSDPSEKRDIENRLRVLNPAIEQTLIDTNRFRSIAGWLHMALLEMTELSDFKDDPSWIQSRLKFEVSTEEINDALDRLVELGLLQASGDSLQKTSASLTTPKNRASDAIREHHRQVLDIAKISVDQQGVSERVLNSCTMTVDSSRLPEAQELILKFRKEMAKLMEASPGDETYQLSVQFFKLTEDTAITSIGKKQENL